MKKSLGPKPLAYATPVWVIGSYDDKNRPNAMTASWAGICCSKPPAVCVSLRRATYTYHNIMKRQAYTVSIPSEKYIAQADYFGMASGKEIDKFAKTGLTPAKSEVVDAPYVAEFGLILECKLIHWHEIGLHTQFVGQIIDIKADEELLGADGLPDVLKLKPFIYLPEVEDYFALGQRLGKAWELGRGI